MKAIIILFLTAFLLACAGNYYEDYTPAIVVTSVEYDGEPYSMGCRGEFKCDKGALECVHYFHEKAQNHIGKVKDLVATGKENIPIITELYNALCNLYEARAYIAALKTKNQQDWAILEKTGFIKQVSMVATILAIKIRQLENENNYSE